MAISCMHSDTELNQVSESDWSSVSVSESVQDIAIGIYTFYLLSLIKPFYIK